MSRITRNLPLDGLISLRCDLQTENPKKRKSSRKHAKRKETRRLTLRLLILSLFSNAWRLSKAEDLRSKSAAAMAPRFGECKVCFLKNEDERKIRGGRRIFV